jgi:drug/metabolite transporter (DMT)-like permease
LQSRAASAATASPVAEPGHPWWGYFFIATATLCFAAGVNVGKKVFNGSFFSGQPLISPLVITQARTSFTVIVLALLLALRFGRGIFRISRSDLGLCLLVGTLGVACSNYFYYLAAQIATISLAITVQYTAPVWVLLYMALSGKERATAQKTAAALVAMVGTAMAIGIFQSHDRLNAWGVGAALIASFGYAFYNITGPGLVTRNHQLTVMFYILLSAAVLWLVVDPPWRLAGQHYSPGQWGFLFLFACFTMLVPYMLYFSGLRYLDPTRAIITSCLEPVFTIVFAVIFVGENLRALQVAGIAAVLAATVMVQTRPPSQSAA